MDETGRLRKRLRRLPRSEWAVLIQDHHEGFIDWNTYEMNQARIKQMRARPFAQIILNRIFRDIP